MERSRGKRAMLRLLDRANAIDRFEKRNTVLRATYLPEAALNAIALAATLPFAHGQTTK
jgi:hypothetical protein